MSTSKIINKTIDYIWAVCKLAYWFVIFGVTALIIYLISKECYYETQGVFHEQFEMPCYCLCVFCLYNVYYLISKKMLKWKYRISLAAIFSVVATGTVFFLNNLWKYYNFNAMFDWVNPLRFTYFLKYDLTYTIGLAEFRYPVMLLGVFLLYLSVSGLILKTKRVFTFDNFLNALSKICPPEDEEEDIVSCDEFIDGLQEAQEKDKVKRDLIEAIKIDDWAKVYDVLIEKRDELLKAEERDMIIVERLVK